MPHTISNRSPSRGWVTVPEMRLLVLVLLISVTAMALAVTVTVPLWLHTLGLFLHLVSLIIGLGAVIAVDWYGLRYLRRHTSLQSVLIQAHRMGPLIWLGLLGLTTSGTMLGPRLTSPLTVIKLAAVLGVAAVGVLVTATKRRMAAELPNPPRALLRRGATLAGVSQIFWWTALIIGFINAQH